RRTATRSWRRSKPSWRKRPNSSARKHNRHVMAGLGPATHERRASARHEKQKLVDGRHEAGHEARNMGEPQPTDRAILLARATALGRTPMQVLNFHLMPYPEIPGNPYDKYDSAWITFPNTYFDPKVAHATYQRYLDELELCDALGFD